MIAHPTLAVTASTKKPRTAPSTISRGNPLLSLILVLILIAGALTAGIIWLLEDKRPADNTELASPKALTPEKQQPAPAKKSDTAPAKTETPISPPPAEREWATTERAPAKPQSRVPEPPRMPIATAPTAERKQPSARKVETNKE